MTEQLRDDDGSPLDLGNELRRALDVLAQVVREQPARLRGREAGLVREVGRGIAQIEGLPNVRSEELLLFAGKHQGFAFNLDRHQVGCVLLDEGRSLRAGARVERTGRVLDTPVGDQLLGRVIDPLGRPLDGGRPISAAERWPVERDATPIIRRGPVTVPLQTGIKVLDALLPIGRGQRQLILGDRQTGKTTLAIDTMINQRGGDMICIYCSIGRRTTSVARVIANLRAHQAMDHSIVVIGADDTTPGLQFVAPYAATSIGEYFMERGRDVVLVYDDLTSHARAYRQISLLLRRPPGREAYPGDIFYIHSRLLERSTRLRKTAGGGSLTALPIIETEAQNVAAYIPTNLISITDGQVYLSPALFRKGVLPAVDVARSVSRVGGKAQLPAYRTVASDLRLTYSQFEELEKFARFSSQLDPETRATLARGRRVREVLKQPPHLPISVPEQIVQLVAVTAGLFDDWPVETLTVASRVVSQSVVDELPELCRRVIEGGFLSPQDLGQIRDAAARELALLRDESARESSAGG